MTDSNSISEAYQAYLQHPEKEIVYEGLRYFRIVYKTGFRLKGVWTMFVTIPIQMLTRKRLPVVVKDVLGASITLKEPIHISFHDSIPDWYMDTLTFPIHHIPDIDWYLGIPNEVEMSPEQEEQEKELQELSPVIASEITKTRSASRPDGVEEWDGGIDVDHRWQFSSEAERIAVLRHFIDRVRENTGNTQQSPQEP